MFDSVNQFRKTYLSYMMWVPLTVLVLLILVLLPESLKTPYTNTILPLAPLISIALGISLLRKYKQFENRSTVILLMAFFVLFLLGEVSWAVLESLGLEPFPSIADGFWILGYFPLIFAMMNAKRLKAGATHVMSKMKMYGLQIGWLAVATVMIAYLFRVGIAWELAQFEMGIYLAYPILDTLVVLLIIPLFMLYRVRGLRFYWLLLLIGIFAQASGDILFFLYEGAEIYFTGSLPDLFFMISYSAFGLGFLLLTKTIEGDKAHNVEIDTKLQGTIQQSAKFSAFSIVGLSGLVIVEEILESVIQNATFKNSLIWAIGIAVAISLLFGIVKVGIVEKRQQAKKHEEDLVHYKESLKELLADHLLTAREELILQHLRESLSVSAEEHTQLHQEVLAQIGKRS